MDLFQKSKNKAVMTKSRIDLKISNRKEVTAITCTRALSQFFTDSTYHLSFISHLCWFAQKLGKAKCTFIKK